MCTQWSCHGQINQTNFHASNFGPKIRLATDYSNRTPHIFMTRVRQTEPQFHRKLMRSHNRSVLACVCTMRLAYNKCWFDF